MNASRAGGNTSFQRKTRDHVWLIAWAMTVLLHVVAFLFFQKLGPLQAAPVTESQPQPIKLVFTKPEPRSSTSDEPQMFSELPADRADAKPEHPEFLSNVTSRARDRVPGGDSNLPHMQGDADVPLVKLQSGGAPSRATAAQQPAPQPPDASPPSAVTDHSDADGSQPKSGTSVLQRPSPQRPNVEPSRGAGGTSDTDQPEMQNPGGNTGLLGDVSLNTIAWDYAPWLQRFGIQLKEGWYPPPAYLLGILKDGGWAQFEVEISKSGKLLRLDLLEEQGHPSLIRSAKSAISTMSPIEPLPADFPEPTLILRIRMIYPKYRTR